MVLTRESCDGWVGGGGVGVGWGLQLQYSQCQGPCCLSADWADGLTLREWWWCRRGSGVGWRDFEEEQKFGHLPCCAKLLEDPNSKILHLNVAF